MSMRRAVRARRPSGDRGGTATGFLLALLVIALIGVAAFFYFGGEADVDIKDPNVEVSTSPDPT